MTEALDGEVSWLLGLPGSSASPHRDCLGTAEVPGSVCSFCTRTCVAANTWDKVTDLNDQYTGSLAFQDSKCINATTLTDWKVSIIEDYLESRVSFA